MFKISVSFCHLHHRYILLFLIFQVVKGNSNGKRNPLTDRLITQVKEHIEVLHQTLNY